MFKPQHLIGGIVGCMFLVGGAYLAAERGNGAKVKAKADDIRDISVVASGAHIDATIPLNIYPCLPGSLSKAELWGKVKDEQVIYYLLGIGEGAEGDATEVLIQEDSRGCLSVISPGFYGKDLVGDPPPPLARYVPLNVARKLRLESYKQAIANAGGREKFQQLWLSDTEAPSYLYPEEVWALNQLGIKLTGKETILDSSPENETERLQSFMPPSLQPGWSFIPNGAPPELTRHLARSVSSTDFPVDVRRMRVLKVDSRNQTVPLYLIDTRISQNTAVDPSCGSAGCTFLGFVPSNVGFRKIMGVFLNWNENSVVLPGSLANGLPCLDLREKEKGTTQTVQWCYDGKEYQPVDPAGTS